MAKNQLLKTFVVVAATMLFLFSVTRLLIYRCCVGLVTVWLCYFFLIFVWFVCSFNFCFSIELKMNEQQQLKLIFNICVVLTYIHLNHKCTLDSFWFFFSFISLKRSLRTFFSFLNFNSFFLWSFSTVLKRQFFYNTFGSKCKFEKFLQLYHETEAI